MQLLADARAEAEATLSGHGSDIIAIWLGALAVLRTELAYILASGDTSTARLVRKAQQMAALHIAEAAQLSSERAMRDIMSMIKAAGASELAMITSQLPPSVANRLANPPMTALDAIEKRVRQQITARSYYLSKEAAQELRIALRAGIADGLNPREVARRLVAAVEGRFFGGLTRALVIARTELLDAYRTAAMATDKVNSDVLVGWQWHSSLDSRTCISCIAQHGRLYSIDEPGPLDHHQGRCTRIPKTKTWAELGFHGIQEPPGIELKTGPEWFAGLSSERQKSILGPGRYAAWQAGEYPPEKWSVPRENPEWRTSYHPSPVPRADKK